MAPYRAEGVAATFATIAAMTVIAIRQLRRRQHEEVASMESNIVKVQEGIHDGLANRGMVDEKNVKLLL